MGKAIDLTSRIAKKTAKQSVAGAEKVIELTSKRAVKESAKQGIEAIEQGTKASSKGVKSVKNVSKKILDDIDNGFKDLELFETMNVDDKLKSRMEKNLSKKQKKRDAAVNKQLRINEYNNNIKKNNQKRLEHEKIIEAKRLSDLEKSYDGVFDDNNIVFKRKDVINNDGTFNSSKADDYYYKITNEAIDLKNNIKNKYLVDVSIDKAKKFVNEKDILNSKVVNGGTSNVKRSSQSKKNQQRNHNQNKSNSKNNTNINPNNWVYKLAAAGVGGGMVLSMSNNKGQQTNSQLYGQGGY